MGYSIHYSIQDQHKTLYDYWCLKCQLFIGTAESKKDERYTNFINHNNKHNYQKYIKKNNNDVNLTKFDVIKVNNIKINDVNLPLDGH